MGAVRMTPSLPGDGWVEGETLGDKLLMLGFLDVAGTGCTGPSWPRRAPKSGSLPSSSMCASFREVVGGWPDGFDGV